MNLVHLLQAIAHLSSRHREQMWPKRKKKERQHTDFWIILIEVNIFNKNCNLGVTLLLVL
jgi:hypothetical protein